jgi:Flp pilus assembly protein TadB
VTLLAALLAAAAVVALVLRAPPRRPQDVLPARAGAPPAVRRLALEGRAPVLACAVAALAAVVLLPVGIGLVAAGGLVLAGPRLLARLEPSAARDTAARLRADLPLVLDLLGACLAGGAALPDAARAVGLAVPGPAGTRLRAVAAALEVGSPAPVAWAALSGGDPDDPYAAAARTLARAADSGAAAAGVLARLSADARRESRAAGAEAARRAGVLAVAPLGLCFLPAFVLLGVVPVVAGLAGPVLAP